MATYIVYKRDPRTDVMHVLPSLEANLIEVSATIVNSQFSLNDYCVCESDTSAHTAAVLSSRTCYSLDWDDDLDEFWRTEAKPYLTNLLI